eukprot:TRINITY_DN5423_c0_g3_i1.p1 TRINITY_DN5423_c0_g3~~TRINITY_DN5423_c0_g3_i1.p1  ORF type:complete len:1786 (-),score=396.30 TRINITY_DN5423_c0_g3_i1:516-5840(-)
MAPKKKPVLAIEQKHPSAASRLDDSSPEVSRLLKEGLPKALAGFHDAYGRVAKAEDLLKAAPWLEPARDLSQVTQRLRDLSWRTTLQKEEAQCIEDLYSRAMSTMQTLVTLVGSFDLRASLSKGVTPASFLGASLLGLEVSTLYCVLASGFGMPPSLVVEELSVGIVRLLKQSLLQLVMPQLSTEAERGKKASAEGGSHERSLAFSAEEGAAICAAAAGLMQALHEFLSRHLLGEDQLHQLIHMAMSLFFVSEANFRLCTAAEELLVSIFARRSSLRSSILQEFLVRAPRLPSGKRAKKFLLPVTEESPDIGLTTWTHMLLRLCQSTCLPLQEPIGADVEFDMVAERRPAAQAAVMQLTGGLLQRLVLTKSKDDESRSIFDDFTDELLGVFCKPAWPAAFAMLRSLMQQLVGMLQEKKREAGDVTVREFALKAVSRILVRFWHHSTDMSKSLVRLPLWTQPPEEVAQRQKSERMLQHVALRVSLEDGRDMPWTKAARAVEAWDAELFLAKAATDAQTAGLCDLSDNIVFGYITLAFLADECTVPLLCPPSSISDTAAPAAPLSAAVFGASHPVHTWSFLVCDWAEAASQQASAAAGQGKDGERSRKAKATTALERFLGSAWCSPTLVTETANWRRPAGSVRRVLMPYEVYKVYRQLRVQELAPLSRAALDCVVMQANSSHATIRKTAMRALSDLVDMDLSVLTIRTVEETVDMRLCDESSWVRQVSLDLLGRILEDTLVEDGQVEAKVGLDEAQAASASQMLLRFHKTVRGRVNDTAVVVRRQATKILSAFVLKHPDHPDVVPVTLDLLRRSTDSETLRNLVLGTFELLWFMDDEPTPQAARQLSRVVDASRAMPSSAGDLLQELLGRFRKTVGSRKNSKGYEFAMRRWTTLILNEFVQSKCRQDRVPAAPRGRRLKIVTDAKLEVKGEPSELPEEQWLLRRSLLSTLEAFAVAQPQDLLVHLRPLTIYLALEDDSPQEEQWVAIKVCSILSSVLPYVAERRGLMDHRQVQADLQALIRNQPSGGVHEAVRCLCLVVKYVTGDLAQLVSHLNVAVPSLLLLCTSAEQKPGSIDRIQTMYMSRQAWVLASILESLNIDEYVQLEGIPADEQPKRRLLRRADLKFDFVGDGVASTVVDILLRLNALGDPQLRAVVVSCIGFFLKGQRSYSKDRRISELLAGDLSAGDLQICKKALETLSSLLSHYRLEADKESRAGARDFNDSRDGRVAGNHDAGPGEAPRSSSAVEAAQPLAAFSDVVLGHITLAGSLGPGAGKQPQAGIKKSKRSQSSGREVDQPQNREQRSEEVLKVRVEALQVVRHLHQQGLVNPMVVLPKIFALAFVGDLRLSEPATLMLKEMLELRPSLLLNRLDEAFREAFLAMLSSAGTTHPVRMGEAPSAAQLAGLGEVYAERYRKLKAMREAFLRKALRELFRLQADRFQERFAELAALGAVQLLDEEDYSLGSSGRARGRAGSRPGKSPGGALLQGLPLLQQQQLLYAQFLASALSALPFSFESEPLLLIFECNHHLSLNAGTLLASHENCEAPSGSSVESADQIFAEALSIVTSVVLKGALKKEYGLSAQQCASFNPKEVKQEKLKPFTAGVFGARDEAQQQHVGVRVRFPAADWLKMVEPLVEAFGRPKDIAEYIRKITDTDPWDDSRTRHADRIDQLEGRRPTRRREPVAPATEEKNSARGRGRGRGRGKPAGTKNYSLRKRIKNDDEDSDFEPPGRKTPPAKRQRGARRQAQVGAVTHDEDDGDQVQEGTDEDEEDNADVD